MDDGNEELFKLMQQEYDKIKKHGFGREKVKPASQKSKTKKYSKPAPNLPKYYHVLTKDKEQSLFVFEADFVTGFVLYLMNENGKEYRVIVEKAATDTIKVGLQEEDVTVFVRVKKDLW